RGKIICVTNYAHRDGVKPPTSGQPEKVNFGQPAPPRYYFLKTPASPSRRHRFPRSRLFSPALRSRSAASSNPMDIKKFSVIAGVSTATVSRAFSGRGRIKETTRQRIFDLAEKHGYTP